jgi:hypothetical protein
MAVKFIFHLTEKNFSVLPSCHIFPFSVLLKAFPSFLLFILSSDLFNVKKYLIVSFTGLFFGFLTILMYAGTKDFFVKVG